MSKHNLFFLTILVTLLPVIGFAQGEFVSAGTSGISLSGNYTIDKDAKGYGIMGSFTAKGVVDFGFSFTHISLDNTYYWEEDSGSIKGGHLALHPFYKYPSALKLSIESSLLLYKFENSNTVYSVLPYLHFDTEKDTNRKLLYRFGIGYSNTLLRGTSDGELMYSFGLSYCYSIKNSNLIFLTPTFIRINDVNSFNINLGILFINQPKKIENGFFDN